MSSKKTKVNVVELVRVKLLPLPPELALVVLQYMQKHHKKTFTARYKNEVTVEVTVDFAVMIEASTPYLVVSDKRTKGADLEKEHQVFAQIANAFIDGLLTEDPTD